MKLDVHIDSLDDSKLKQAKLNQNALGKPSNAGPNKPVTTKQDPNATYIDLHVIGVAVSQFLLKTTSHKIAPEQIKVLYLDGAGDAICFCQNQYDFYNGKNRPDKTPLYLYTGRDGKVIKVPINNEGMFNLGTAGQFVDSLNRDGYNFMAAADLVV